MRRVIITVGIPASGKTTWANEYIKTHPNTVISCRDDIRAEEKLPYGDAKAEQWITQVQRGHIKFALLNAQSDVIVADTNIVQSFRRELIDFCLSLGAVVEILTFPCSLKTALKRDAKRENPVGFGVIARFKRMEENSPYIGNCIISLNNDTGDEEYGYVYPTDDALSVGVDQKPGV